MTAEKIVAIITPLIELSEKEQEIERPKIEFKREWYKLKTDPGISEFIKDTSAMANTVGLDGFIVFGYDTETKSFHKVKFTDSGLRDPSELYTQVAKHVVDPFTIEFYTISIDGHKLDVLHIPPSLGKPHIIKRHRTFDKEGKEKKFEENRILIRKSTGIFPATKYDIDFMYYDRKNLVPEYELHSSLEFSTAEFASTTIEYTKADKRCDEIRMTAYITFENTGRRPIMFDGIEMLISVGSDDIPYKFSLMDGIHLQYPTVIRSQDVFRGQWRFGTSITDVISDIVGRAKCNALINNRNALIVHKLIVTTTTKMTIYPIFKQV